MPIRVLESVRCDWDSCETTAVVAVEVVRIAAHAHLESAHVWTHDELVLLGEFRNDLVPPRRDLPHHLIEGALLRRETVFEAVRPIVRDVEVETTVTIDIGQRECRSALTDRVQSQVAAFRE